MATKKKTAASDATVWSKEMIRTLIEMVEGGSYRDEIAEALGLSETAITDKAGQVRKVQRARGDKPLRMIRRRPRGTIEEILDELSADDGEALEALEGGR